MRDKRYDIPPEEMKEKSIDFIKDQLEKCNIDLGEGLKAMNGDGVCLLSKFDIENDEDNTFHKSAFRMLINCSDEDTLLYAKELLDAELEFINGE